MTNWFKKFIAAVSLSGLVLATPAMADCMAPISTVKEAATQIEGASVTKISEADKVKLFEAISAPPNVEEPYGIYVILTPDMARILITKPTAPDGGDCVEDYSGELNVRAIRNVLGLEEARASLAR